MGLYFCFCLILLGDRFIFIVLGLIFRIIIIGLVIFDEVGGGVGLIGCLWWVVDFGFGMFVFGFILKDFWVGFVLLLDVWLFVCEGLLVVVGCKIEW